MLHILNSVKTQHRRIRYNSTPDEISQSEFETIIPLAAFTSQTDIEKRYPGKRSSFDEIADRVSLESRKTRVIKALKKRLKTFWSVLALIAFILFSSSILFAIETYQGVPDSDIFAENTSMCLAANSYWATIIYVDGLATAVGMNGITTCTNIGKCFAVLCTIFGVPLSLLVLSQVGEKSCSCLHFCFVQGRRRIRPYFKRIKPGDENENDDNVTTTTDDEELLDVPVSFGIILVVAWMLMCSGVFACCRPWPYGETTYFSFMMLTTGVLTNVTTFSWPLSLFTMVAIFFGLAFISNMIKIIQSNIEHMITRVERRIEKEFKHALENDLNDPNAGETVEERIDRILKETNAPSWMAAMIPKEQMDVRLVEQCEKFTDVACVETQTDPLPSPPTPISFHVPELVRTVDSSSQPDPIIPVATFDTLCQTHSLKLINTSSQTSQPKLVDKKTLCIASTADACVDCAHAYSSQSSDTVGLIPEPQLRNALIQCLEVSGPRTQEHCSVQIEPCTEDICVMCVMQNDTKDVSSTARPSTRTVITQFPKAQSWYTIKEALPSSDGAFMSLSPKDKDKRLNRKVSNSVLLRNEPGPSGVDTLTQRRSSHK